MAYLAHIYGLHYISELDPEAHESKGRRGMVENELAILNTRAFITQGSTEAIQFNT